MSTSNNPPNASPGGQEYASDWENFDSSSVASNESYESDITVAGPSNAAYGQGNNPNFLYNHNPNGGFRLLNVNRRLARSNDTNPDIVNPPPPYPSPPAYGPPDDPPPYGPTAGGGNGGQASVPNILADIARDADLEVDRIKNYFEQNTRRFTFEGKIGHGLTGVTCQVKQRRSLLRGLPSRRFVVKRALYGYQEPFLRNEIRTLRKLRRGQHIVKPVKIRNRALLLRDPLRGAPGKTLYMELVENGSLKDMIERAAARGVPLPNRLLWRFFLCLVQFCIAMAFPKTQVLNGPRGRERIPTDPYQLYRKYQLRHADMNLGNILIGNVDLEDDKHDLVPILKLIGFDRAQVFDLPGDLNRNLGVKWNIFDIGLVMRSLITGDRTMTPQFGDVAVQIPSTGAWTTITTYGADITAHAYPSLDPDLRLMVMSCLSRTVAASPTLEQLYAKVRGCHDRDADYYSGSAGEGASETNVLIRRLVQELILDADH